MNQINEFIQRLHAVEGAILNRLPDPNPYVPNGRDNLEQNLQQQFYDSLEATFSIQFLPSITLLLLEMRIFGPYFNKELTTLDWFCTILAHLLLLFFMISIFFFKYIGRKQAYLINLPNSFILILLEFANAFNIGYYVIIGESLRCLWVRDKYFMGFFHVLYFIIKYVEMLHQNIQNYILLKNHQLILDTIPQLPYAPKGG